MQTLRNKFLRQLHTGGGYYFLFRLYTVAGDWVIYGGRGLSYIRWQGTELYTVAGGWVIYGGRGLSYIRWQGTEFYTVAGDWVTVSRQGQAGGIGPTIASTPRQCPGLQKRSERPWWGQQYWQSMSWEKFRPRWQVSRVPADTPAGSWRIRWSRGHTKGGNLGNNNERRAALLATWWRCRYKCWSVTAWVAASPCMEVYTSALYLTCYPHPPPAPTPPTSGYHNYFYRAG